MELEPCMLFLYGQRHAAKLSAEEHASCCSQQVAEELQLQQHGSHMMMPACAKMTGSCHIAAALFRDNKFVAYDGK
jgi:hypothetical protein